MNIEAAEQFEAFVEAPARRVHLGLNVFFAVFLFCAAAIMLMG